MVLRQQWCKCTIHAAAASVTIVCRRSNFLFDAETEEIGLIDFGAVRLLALYDTHSWNCDRSEFIEMNDGHVLYL